MTKDDKRSILKEMHMKRIAYAVVAIVLFSGGCKTDVTVEVYSSDLHKVVTDKTSGLMTPMIMAIEIPSEQKCDEYTPQIADVMKGLVNSFSPQGCKRMGMESRLLAEVQIPLSPSMAAWDRANSLFGLVISDKTGGVVVTLDLDKYEILSKRMQSKFHQSVNLSESKVTMILHNDERNTQTYRVGGAFINRDPVYQKQWINLKRRGKVEIQLSNVGSASLAKHGHALILAFKKED